MKDYQPIKNNPNWIPHNIYMTTLYFIRAYYEYKELHDEIIAESPAPADGQPRGTAISDPTSQKAQKVEQIYDDICIIDDSLKAVPQEHRDVVWRNVMYRQPFKEMGDRSERAYAYWKGVFIRNVAERKHFI